MSTDPKTNSEGGSFAEKPEEEKQTSIPKKPAEEETVFVYMKEMIEVMKAEVKAIEAKEAQTAHHLDKIASALEKLAKMETDKEDLKKAPVPTPVAPVAKPILPTTTTPAPLPVLTKPAEPAVPAVIDTIKSAFPTELANMLYFELNGDEVTIKPRQYLGSENFAKIASIVRSISGEYVSAGRDSHFRVVPQKK